ncbi:hypothetical protein [Jiella pelagia]|uniref:Uncharacterized protein n=1 Tax=Jiella pelagia TaxID=2986949 RepID=A0ABY7C2Q5_9HYPH|nr:hypothetical protein [Jiella pelagia]WAP69043.1 hypothetical protein OH818_01525 [Jiella pelagia]
MERKDIRKAFKSALEGKTQAGFKVFTSRAQALSPSDLPCIVVYSRSEAVEEYNAAPLEYKRTVSIAIEIIANGLRELDDALDDIAEDVERVVFSDDTLGGACSDIRLSQVEMDITSEGDTPIGSCRLTFDCIYYKEAPQDLSGALDNFDKAHLRYDISPSDGSNEAEDEVIMPQ